MTPTATVAPPDPPPTPERPARRSSTTRRQLTTAEPSRQTGAAAALAATIRRAEAELAAARSPRVRHREIVESIARLSNEATTRGLIDAVPAQACAALGFTRAMLSRLEGTFWIPESFASSVPEAALESNFLAARGRRLPVKAMGFEADVARRRIPLLVTASQLDRRTHRPFIDACDARSYVVAPMIVDERVVGLLHLDYIGIGRAADETDLLHARRFSDDVGLLFGLVLARTRLRRQTAALQLLLLEADANADADADASARQLKLLKRHIGPAKPATSISPTVARVLTPREIDVAELIARGMSNKAIAAALGITPGTVKSHVKKILTRLRMSSRTEVAAWYLGHSGRIAFEHMARAA